MKQPIRVQNLLGSPAAPAEIEQPEAGHIPGTQAQPAPRVGMSLGIAEPLRFFDADSRKQEAVRIFVGMHARDLLEDRRKEDHASAVILEVPGMQASAGYSVKQRGQESAWAKWVSHRRTHVPLLEPCCGDAKHESRNGVLHRCDNGCSARSQENWLESRPRGGGIGFADSPLEKMTAAQRTALRRELEERIGRPIRSDRELEEELIRTVYQLAKD